MAIARALVQQPKVLLLDEPFSALDNFTKKNLQDHVRNLWSSLKVTIVMVTHDIDEATMISDRVLILKKPIQNEISNNRLIKINQPRSDSDKDQYNKLINDIIFNDSSNQINAII